ncbi:MAG: sialate O-acetylesterase [Armatimonadetes bacterium]|nr:sialate O-acetylesterase [Armatimonadota bacterium]
MAELVVHSPLPDQVIQRTGNSGNICVRVQSESSVTARLLDRKGQEVAEAHNHSGTCEFTIEDVPVGGPYTLDVSSAKARVRVRGILVGDLWALAGQSNMDGCGKMRELEPPCEHVHALFYNETWGIARDPLCHLRESIHPVHYQEEDSVERERLAREFREFLPYGAGLGVRFGKDLFKATGVPVGLVVCSHGGTSMAQWDPKLKSEGGRSLYGAMMLRLQSAGGKIAGCLWYQGESDALAGVEIANGYRENFKELIVTLRKDMHQPDLPFIYAQLANFFTFEEPATFDGWNAVRRAQLEIEGELRNVAMVANIDATLSDAIHADALSQRRLGARMALAARRLLLGENNFTLGPRPLGAQIVGPRSIRVDFAQVNGKLHPAKGMQGFIIRNEERPVVVTSACRHPDKPSSVLLTTAEAPEAGWVLGYGLGTNPNVNVRDSRGFPAPMFGLIDVST